MHVSEGYLDAHRTSPATIYDRHRGTDSPRGCNSDREYTREEALKRDRYLCVHCLSGVMEAFKSNQPLF
jgi:hypothetical protein